MKHYIPILFVLLLPNLLFAASPDEQVQQTITGIYQLEKSFDRLITQTEDEEKIKSGFKKIISQLTTGSLLNRWDEFIKNTPIRSTFYRTVFETMTPVDGFEIQKSDVGSSRATVDVVLQISELYTPSIDLITLEELYAKYKITNLTIPEVIAKLPTNSLAELVEYRITSKRQDTHKLKLVNGVWKIKNIDQKILSSTIEVKLPKKK